MKKFLFGINTKVINKTPRCGGFEALQKNWQTKEGTVEDLASYIKQGFAFMPGLLDGDRRSKTNVRAAQMLALDIDQGLTISEALEHPFIKAFCALAYTTHSHQKDKGGVIGDRYRLVFVLPELVESRELIEAAIANLMELIPQADKACKDVSRLYYGNTEADILFSERTKILPISFKNLAKKKIVEERKPILNQFSNSNDLDKLILEALSFIPPRQPGTGNYHQSLRVAMALHSHYENAAIPIIEYWSPSIRGTTWNVPLKVRSFKRQGVGLGTLFWIAKQYGFKF